MSKLWVIPLVGVVLATLYVFAVDEEHQQAPANIEHETPADSSSFYTDDERNNIAVFEDASPSVVFVTNTQLRRQRFSLNVMEIPRGSGTGLIWDESGLIVTNFHVVYGSW